MDSHFKNLIDCYIRAKDENLPHLLKQVFQEDSILYMEVKTDEISFPSEVKGRDQITETLVRSFNQSYKNICTVCLSDSIEQQQNRLKCRWLVTMNEKDSGSLKVGYGHYEWSTGGAKNALIKSLHIVIQNMLLLPPDSEAVSLQRFTQSASPWATSSAVKSTLRGIDSLSALHAAIDR